jgi:small subunit ribosomal protein S9
MADEEQQPPADDQPSAEGAESPAEETSPPAPEETPPPAPEAQADQEVTDGEAPQAEAPAEEAPPAEAPAAEAAIEPPAEEATAEAPPEEPRRQRPPRREADEQAEETVVPGAHLEPDLVLEERQAAPEGEFDAYAAAAGEDDEAPIAEGEEAATVEDTTAPAAAPRTPLDLAADARYRATGKRKRAVARVILKPGQGTYTINGKELDTYFPRATLQKHARQPLETTGNGSRMDVVAKIHGGGVSAQAIALRHGIARALVEADPALRGDLKRQGFLTRDARVKERKKAGLKKARKRPQFSKR